MEEHELVEGDEAVAVEGYKDMIVDCDSKDIIYSNLFTGVHGNYLAPSIAKAGLDPNNLPESDPSAMNFGSGGNQEAKAWKDIWGCGQGIGTIDHTPVYPREVIKRALELSATAIILVHNHPSGDPTPSRADIDMTHMIINSAKPLGITVHDHIIIGKDGYVSFKGLKLI